MNNIASFNLRKVNKIALELIHEDYKHIANKIIDENLEIDENFFNLFSRELGIQRSYTNYVYFLEYYYFSHGKSDYK